MQPREMAAQARRRVEWVCAQPLPPAGAPVAAGQSGRAGDWPGGRGPGPASSLRVEGHLGGVRGAGGPTGAGRRLRPGRGRRLWGAPLCPPAPWSGPPDTDPHGEGGWVVTPNHR